MILGFILGVVFTFLIFGFCFWLMKPKEFANIISKLIGDRPDDRK